MVYHRGWKAGRGAARMASASRGGGVPRYKDGGAAFGWPSAASAPWGRRQGWREVLACCAWRPERRLRNCGRVDGMPLAAWAAGHASVAWTASLLSVVYARPVFWAVIATVEVVRVSGRKSCLTCSVPATAALEGVVFPPWRRCCGVLTPLRPPFQGESPNLAIAGLDDGGVFGCRDLLGGVIFSECLGAITAMP
jgi:hypothetical protein